MPRWIFKWSHLSIMHCFVSNTHTVSRDKPARLRFSDTETAMLSNTHWLPVASASASAGQEVSADFVQDGTAFALVKNTHFSQIRCWVFYPHLELTRQDARTATGLVWFTLPYHLIISNNFGLDSIYALFGLNILCGKSCPCNFFDIFYVCRMNCDRLNNTGLNTVFEDQYL